MSAIRKLYASEIECRVAQCGKRGDEAWCSILLYKDARVDMRILDEVYGPMNWKRKHDLIGGRLYCTISIYDPEKKEWIEKQDVGTESFTEKEKGQASDSFKRAGFNVGIGRELYTAPKIFINLDKGEWKENNGKVVPTITLDVKEIHYDGDGNICSLVLMDSKSGNVKYTYGSPTPKASSAPAKKTPMMYKTHDKWQDMLNAVLAGKYTWEQLTKMYDFPEADLIEGKAWVLEHMQ